MASQLLNLFLILNSFFILSASTATNTIVTQDKTCPFESIYQFGDSISDVGNLIRKGPAGAKSYAARLPYGGAFLHGPTGRCSNGLLMIGYIAMALRLPLLNPYQQPFVLKDHGVNFAVAGSTVGAKVCRGDTSSYTAGCIAACFTVMSGKLAVRCVYLRPCATIVKVSLVLMLTSGADYLSSVFECLTSLEKLRGLSYSLAGLRVSRGSIVPRAEYPVGHHDVPTGCGKKVEVTHRIELTALSRVPEGKLAAFFDAFALASSVAAIDIVDFDEMELENVDLDWSISFIGGMAVALVILTVRLIFLDLDWVGGMPNRISLYLLEKGADGSDCEKRLQRALMFVGEIGGNEYNYAFSKENQLKKLVPMFPMSSVQQQMPLKK
ncbi:hypothetical protein GIB67_009432 [Kingdonia uniflora]|uniref:Uncharacterized protein n=1 Tax=Kingdonia uniflora TaxID=39325 RepID=A0A7J7N346_9MAGN|nr:hypothetical protein GIB67_009432 [Kingdonia uniflora]